MSAPPTKRMAVFGAGAWGTALAHHFCMAGHTVTLYARDAETAGRIATARENTARLPGIALPPALAVRSFGNAIAADVEVAILAVPAQALPDALAGLALPKSARLVLCAKGIEAQSGRFMSDIAAVVAPEHKAAVLSGPSFAEDLARGLPTAVTLAAAEEGEARALSTALSTPRLRLYANTDVLGVEIGGAAKNVIAIACGVCDGLALGASAKAALIARGFAEMQRFAQACGARQNTLSGLSGLGDLVLTASSPQSRNYA